MQLGIYIHLWKWKDGWIRFFGVYAVGFTRSWAETEQNSRKLWLLQSTNCNKKKGEWRNKSQNTFRHGSILWNWADRWLNLFLNPTWLIWNVNLMNKLFQFHNFPLEITHFMKAGKIDLQCICSCHPHRELASEWRKIRNSLRLKHLIRSHRSHIWEDLTLVMEMAWGPKQTASLLIKLTPNTQTNHSSSKELSRRMNRIYNQTS